ncbi:DUF4199 family protein [bacterium]|nr:DUF4199 family protein [bacterium]
MDIKTELKIGFWMAFAMFIWWIGEYLLGIQGENMQYKTMSMLLSNTLVIVIGCYMAMRAAKFKTPANDLKYGTLALSAGVTLLAASVLVLVLSSIFYHFVNSGYTDYMVQKQMAKQDPTTSVEELTKREEMYHAVFAPGSMGMANFSNMVMLGFFIILIEALVVLKLPLGAATKKP